MLKGDPFFPGLLAGVEIAFKHQPHDCVAAFAELPQYFVSDHALAGVIFLGVVMGAIDHDGTSDVFAGDRRLSFGDLFRLVVCFSASAAEHDMAVRIPHGLDDGGLAVGIDTDKMVRSARRNHGVHRDLQATFSPVLEADRHGDAACHLAMGLAFGRARADGGPTDKIGHVLRTDRVQQFRSTGEAHLIDLEQKRSRQLNSRCDIAGPVQVRVIDEALPSDCRPGLFKVCSHHDQKSVAKGIGNRLQLGSIFVGRIGIMDGTGPYDHEEPVTVLSMEDSANRFSGFHHERRCLIGNRKFGLDGTRRGQCFNLDNVLIVDRSIHGLLCSIWLGSQ